MACDAPHRLTDDEIMWKCGKYGSIPGLIGGIMYYVLNEAFKQENKAEKENIFQLDEQSNLHTNEDNQSTKEKEKNDG